MFVFFVSLVESDVSHKSLYQQGLHHAEQKQPAKAVTCFAQFINENHDNQFHLNDVERCRKAFAKELDNLDGECKSCICVRIFTFLMPDYRLFYFIFTIQECIFKPFC